jgi:dolichyl-phosphate beta-glucosyltransferase
LRLLGHSPNRGKGFALRGGMLEAEGEYVLFSDADLSTPIEELDRFLVRLEQGSPVVIGTRKHREAEIMKRQPIWRETMGKIFTGISNLVLGLHVSDFTCGFKAFHRAAARRLFGTQKIDRWAFDSEILFLARRYGYPVTEIAVRWINSPDSKVRVLRDSVTSFLALFKIRWNAWTGKYD